MENIEWFIPISSNEKEYYNGLLIANNSLMRDATIAKILFTSNQQKVKSLTPFESPHMSRILVDKLYFLSECKALDILVPNFYVLQNSLEMRKLYRQELFSSNRDRPYYLRRLQKSNESRCLTGKY